MDELRWAFLVLGGLAIVGILVHGMWSVRKSSEAKPAAQLETRDNYDEVRRETERDMVIDENAPLLNDDAVVSGQYDDLGLGEVRVVSTTADSDEPDDQNAVVEPLSASDDTETTDEAVSEDVQEGDATPAPKIYSSVVSQPKPEYVAEQEAIQRRAGLDAPGVGFDIPEPPPSLLKSTNRREPTLGKVAEEATAEHIEPAAPEPVKESFTKQAKKLVTRKKVEPVKKRQEPKVREDQIRIDFNEPEVDSADNRSKAAPVEKSPTAEAQQEVLVLNVKAPEDKPIQGAALLPMLLTLGFKFGEQDIFHRHVNSNGKGPVLFSLANMFKPGVFDIDNLENFTTQGVSLFMILPIEGDPHQVFNMMHNAARKIADEFGAQVMDGRRSALTKQRLQQYVEKIREFERQRMIAR